MSKTIFVTYNPDSDIEKNTALRMQTISSLYGIGVELPSRVDSRGTLLSKETSARIKRASFVLAFCIGHLSDQLRSELSEAVKNNKKVVVVYQNGSDFHLDFGEYKDYQSFVLDYYNPENTLHEIAGYLKSSTKDKKQNVDEALGIGLIGLGLGLLVFWALNNDEK